MKAEMVNKRSMERFGMTNLSICGKRRRICRTSELRDELKSLKLEWFELVKTNLEIRGFWVWGCRHINIEKCDIFWRGEICATF